MRPLLVGLCMLLLLAIPLPASARDSGPTGPTRAVLDHLQALLNRDFAAARATLCAAAWPTLDRAAVEAGPDLLRLLVYTTDWSGLVLETTRQGDGWAHIRISGSLRLEVATLNEPLILAAADLGWTAWWAVREAGSWRACPALPERTVARLEPGEVTWLFMERAFSGNYAGARALICAVQRDVFSEQQYAAMMQDYSSQGVTLDLRQTRFDVTYPGPGEALVTLGGTVALSSDQRPKPIIVSAESLGFAPIRLVQENGWKICRAAS